MTTSQKILLGDKLERTRVNHVLHLILSLLTGGAWLIVWLFIVLINNSRKYNLEKAIEREAMPKEVMQDMLNIAGFIIASLLLATLYILAQKGI